MTESALRRAAETASANLLAVLDAAGRDLDLVTEAERHAIRDVRFMCAEIADGDRTARPQTGPLDSGEVKAVG